jgi:hypothetical protein
MTNGTSRTSTPLTVGDTRWVTPAKIRPSSLRDAEACKDIVRGLPEFFTVQTLDPSASYEPYEATRAFWESCGFLHVDTIDPLPDWQPGNPAAIYVAALAATRAHCW